ncbi:phosphopantetheine-binding protein [Streptomyces sp. C8S0]|uniref:phosphopantetheine-binding protein n=1 Tax=Streptomyces sp. C8S0 TaxID=2585716 RepID=UPI00125E85A0|nr:phosphopantetheine-binding protein [Streptomyces sp. C8S0]
MFTGGRLRAFVTLDAPADVAAAVREGAPDYLIPHEVTVLDRLPVNTSGKTDHRALEALCAEDVSTDTAAAAVREPDLEAACALVAETLGVAVIGPDEDFFTAGGDSLLAMTLVAGARTRFGAEGTSLRVFLSRPTRGDSSRRSRRRNP